MSLAFHNTAKDMTFVEDGTHRIVHANELVAGKTYRVFFVLQNSGTEEAPETTIMIRLGESEESVDLDTRIPQPAPVSVPASLNGYPGLAAVEFTFTVPTAERGVIVASIAFGGRALVQRWETQKAATVLPFRSTAAPAPLRVAQ